MLKNLSKKIIPTLFIIFLSISANISLAQSDGTENIKKLGENITNNVLGTASTLLMSAAFLLFFYGVVVFIYGRVTDSGDMKELKKGQEFMLWGLVALFVMVSVWGIIKLFQSTLDINGGNIDIKPVSFSYSGGSSVNSVSSENNTNSLSSGQTSKKIKDADCVGLAGTASECATGLLCRDTKWETVKVGESGTCKTTLTQEVSTYPLIKEGSQDAKLPILFSYLKAMNCTGTKNTFSTTYDSADAVFVENFQKANGLTVDGEVGKDTWKALMSGTAKKCT